MPSDADLVAAAIAELQTGVAPEVPEGPPPQADIIPQFQLPYTDLGNAERLVLRHGFDLHYSHAWKAWLIWDGGRWKVDGDGSIFRRMAETVRSIYAEAEELAGKKERKRAMVWAKTSESYNAIIAATKLAQNLRGVPVDLEILDAQPYLLNCPNGVLDLRTGQLSEHRRELLLTKMTPTNYNPTASAGQWDKFVYEIMTEREALVNYLQRVVGYSLTGDINEKVLFICHGSGNNGKTTFVETIRKTIGEYAGQVPIEALMVQHNTNGQAANPDIADLRGLRFVTSSESEEGHRMAEGKIKYLTGMNRIKARQLYERNWEFTPTWKIWIDANHLPTVRGSDQAIWARIKRIPFELSLEKADIDRDLPERLEQEREGVLRWAVDGCLAWLRDGLGTPGEVEQASTQYHLAMDVLGRFLEEFTEVGTPSNEIQSRHLYRLFCRWCAASGEFAVSERVFGERMVDRGIPRRHTRNGAAYGGLRLIPQLPEESDLLPREQAKGQGWLGDITQ